MLYRTNNIQIDTLNYQLSENGKTIDIEPQAFDLIAYLITHRERLVTRQEIFDNLWSGRIVTDDSLSSLIKKARKLLGDDGKKQNIIKTIHGRGYQFIADIEEIDAQHQPVESSTIDLNSKVNKSIAVLAFTDFSPKQDQQYFSDGISEELINLLAKVSELRVISRTSSFSFKTKTNTAEEIGKLLNVTHLLEGSIRKSGNNIRITTQLIRVSDESHLWSETFNETMDDIFRIQDEIANVVIQKLKILLQVDSTKTTKVNPDAYILYLKAKYFTHQHNPESNHQAETIIKESISVDPEYAPSWLLLSTAIRRDTVNFFAKPYDEGLQQAKKAAYKAIEIDNQYASAFSSLALLNMECWEFNNANNNMEKALLLDSESSAVLNSVSIVTAMSGKLADANNYLKKAITLDPLNYRIHLNLGINHLILHQLDEAADAIKKYDLYYPDSIIHRSILAWVLIEQGKLEEALEVANKEPHEFWRLYALNGVIFASGKHDEANLLFKQFLDKFGDTNPTDIADLYAFRKEKDEAFKWLNIAYDRRDPQIVGAANYYTFRYLWSDPRWDLFLKKLQLPKDHILVTQKNTHPSH